MSRVRWYGRILGALMLVVLLGVGLQPAAAQRASLSGINAKLDEVLHNLDQLTPEPPLPQPFPGDGITGQALRYQDNGDGTVTDLNTGLMWEQKVAGGGTCTGNVHGVDATCMWSEVVGPWITAINAEDGTGYAGYSDWRVPNIRELASIVDYSRPRADSTDIVPSLFAPEFGATGIDPARRDYWSFTTNVNVVSNAWIANFGGTFFEYGVVFSTMPKNSVERVRAVRSAR